jgi:sugar lactone lactonase YvrE
MRNFKFYFLAFLFFMNSCGNKSASEEPTNNIVQEITEEETEKGTSNPVYIIKKNSDLPRCTDNLEKEIYYTEDTGEFKICLYNKEINGFAYEVLTKQGEQGDQGSKGENGDDWPAIKSTKTLPEPIFSVTSSGLDLILTVDEFGVSQAFYTTDETTPTINSELYSSNGITVECCDSVTYKAFRSDWFFPSSNIATYEVKFLYKLDFHFGSYGEANGKFLDPSGLSIGKDNNIFVFDEERSDVQKFSSIGGFVSKFGSSGSEDGQFQGLLGGAVDSEGNLYVLDSSRLDVQKFSSIGGFVSKFGGTYGSGNGEFLYPVGIAIDSNDNIYVVDISRCDVQKFNPDGSYASKFGSCGEGDGMFLIPVGIATDSNGNIYVVDTNRHDVQKFSSEGDFVSKFGSYGAEDGMFLFPVGIAVDQNNNIYVADDNPRNIQKFDSSGIFVSKFGSYGSENGKFKNIRGITIDRNNNIYVADGERYDIQKISPINP